MPGAGVLGADVLAAGVFGAGVLGSEGCGFLDDDADG